MKKPIKPRLEPIEENGELTAVYLRLQHKSRKAVRGFQPNENEPVFFYLDEDDEPVGIMFHRPASGLVVYKVMKTLVRGADGRESVKQKTRHYFLTDPDEILRVLAKVEKAVEDLREPTSC